MEENISDGDDVMAIDKLKVSVEPVACIFGIRVVFIPPEERAGQAIQRSGASSPCH